ncbi:MAG TPA: hypothetical protein VFK43_16315 [Acidimicrobiales bacterium]|nr:hypothetical protein [Acidimicrobiales bacterium]
MVALATALTSCGDDGPSKTEYTTQADGSCTAGNTTISTAAKPTNAPQVATAAGTAMSTIDAQVVALRAMKTPSGDDKDLAVGVINAIAEIVGPTKALQEAAGRNDDAGMSRAALDMQGQADPASNTAQAFGMSQCGVQVKFGLGNLFDGVKQVVKATYVAKGEGLCKDAARKYAAIAPPGNSLASFNRFIEAVNGVSTKLATDFRALQVPPGDEATVGDMLAAVDGLNTKAREAIDAVKAGNERLFIALVDELRVAQTSVNAKLDAYGLKTCGSAAG